MKQSFIQYKTKPEKADENTRHLEAVFRELQEKSPDDVRYAALSLGDGTFVHASNERTGVRVDGLSNRYYAARFEGAETILG